MSESTLITEGQSMRIPKGIANRILGPTLLKKINTMIKKNEEINAQKGKISYNQITNTNLRLGLSYVTNHGDKDLGPFLRHIVDFIIFYSAIPKDLKYVDLYQHILDNMIVFEPMEIIYDGDNKGKLIYRIRTSLLTKLRHLLENRARPEIISDILFNKSIGYLLNAYYLQLINLLAEKVINVDHTHNILTNYVYSFKFFMLCELPENPRTMITALNVNA